jgi:hypothetical protein
LQVGIGIPTALLRDYGMFAPSSFIHKDEILLLFAPISLGFPAAQFELRFYAFLLEGRLELKRVSIKHQGGIP